MLVILGILWNAIASLMPTFLHPEQTIFLKGYELGAQSYLISCWSYLSPFTHYRDVAARMCALSLLSLSVNVAHPLSQCCLPSKKEKNAAWGRPHIPPPPLLHHLHNRLDSFTILIFHLWASVAQSRTCLTLRHHCMGWITQFPPLNFYLLQRNLWIFILLNWHHNYM